eukprot:297221_1
MCSSFLLIAFIWHRICKYNTLSTLGIHCSTICILITMASTQHATCPIKTTYSFPSECGNEAQFAVELPSYTHSSYIDIYIESHKNCTLPIYNITYYQHNITIYNENGIVIKQCHQRFPCKTAATCIVSNTNHITSYESNKIMLSLPSNHNCSFNPTVSIKCSQLNETKNTNLISCTNDEPCTGKLKCPEGQNCLISCQSTENNCHYFDSESCSVCHQAEFYCPKYGSCAVICNGSHACFGSIFYGVNAGVTCSGNWACGEVTFKYSAKAVENTVSCIGFDPCAYSKFDIAIYSSPYWFMITNHDGSEQIILSTRNAAGRIFTISEYGDTIEKFKQFSTNTEYLGFCHECIVNVTGNIEG